MKIKEEFRGYESQEAYLDGFKLSRSPHRVKKTAPSVSIGFDITNLVNGSKAQLLSNLNKSLGNSGTLADWEIQENEIYNIHSRELSKRQLYVNVLATNAIFSGDMPIEAMKYVDNLGEGAIKAGLESGRNPEYILSTHNSWGYSSDKTPKGRFIIEGNRLENLTEKISSDLKTSIPLDRHGKEGQYQQFSAGNQYA